MSKLHKQPISVGETLIEEFMKPMGINQTQLAQAMGIQRRLVNEVCRNRRVITADTALMLSRVFGNSAEFWLNLQHDNDLWAALHDPKRRQRIERAHPVAATV
ncbi:MAG TPA: HigA family addiction module antitoxin [Modicisalibacter sp.]|nr:HigA family addiction module antitoxin [Modicisalibacter sp.]